MTDPVLDIESTTNHRVKAWAALSRRSERDRTGTFLIEGARETERASQGLDIQEIIWCPGYTDTQPAARERVTKVSVRVFDKISHRQNPDGVASVGRTPDVTLASFSPRDNPLVLVGDSIEKPGNIGAMLRSCDAFGAAFIGSSLATDLVNPNVIRAAQGSLFVTAVASVPVDEALAWCTANTQVIVAHPNGGVPLWERDLRGPTSVVIGSEHAGIDPKWIVAGEPTFIPMSGVADSLNASVSAGVFLAEASRQRSG
jgi:TrmH family RNA methyltransferase